MAKKRKKGLAAVLGTVVSIAVPIFAPAIAGLLALLALSRQPLLVLLAAQRARLFPEATH